MKMKKYELMTIISSTITDPEIQERIKGLKELLGDDVVYEEIWGMREFAFPIKKQPKGYYAVWNFRTDEAGIKELEASLKMYPDLLRYLLITVPEDYTPITLPEIEAGLEALRKEKEEKRAGRRGRKTKKKEEKEEKQEKPAEKPTEKEAEKAPEKEAEKEPEKPAEKAAEAPAAEEKPAEKPAKPDEEKPAKDKTLDQKLDDILSDEDLGL